MKIQCDVCDKEEASVFCSADEAALCDSCDHRVHHANKLAGRHLRFSLLRPPFKDSPFCDICQERRALLFCQEDRAILCKECDIPIHKANEHTQKHNRFLLTGVKLSAIFSSSYPASSSSNNACEVATDSNQFYNDQSLSDHDQNALPSTPTSAVPSKVDDNCISQEGSISTSSISEYLMETLPGWQVEDFLDPSCSSHGFCKNYDYEHKLPFMDHEIKGNFYPFPSEDMTIWVPQASQQTGVINGPKGSEDKNKVMKFSRKWSN